MTSFAYANALQRRKHHRPPGASVTGRTDSQAIKLSDSVTERVMRHNNECAAFLAQIQAWTPAATTSPSTDGGRAGGTSKPVESKALPRTRACDIDDPGHKHDQVCSPPDRWREDEFTNARKRYIKAWEEIDKILNGMDFTVERMTPLAQDEARRQAETEAAISSTCCNLSCRAVISGLGDDRPRGGRCNACREYRRVNGIERPHSLVHRIPLPECAHCARLQVVSV